MSTEDPPRSTTGGRSRERASANPYRLFAVTVMLVLALWQVLSGLSAVLRDNLGATPTDGAAAWGWVVLLIGVLTALAGVGVVRDRSGADTAAIVLAGLSMLASFVLVPFYPLWSAVIIALDVTVVWALTTHRRTAGT